ncbi:MAG: hypothetical protein IJU44_04670 [Kiritimatiellae bacterium]|nr:hypothetical protein [Kiritimatiellia bacterium]
MKGFLLDMRFLAVALLVALSIDTAAAASLGHWGSSFPEAKTLAAAEDRPILVLFTNDSGASRWCNEFNEKVLLTADWLQLMSWERLALVKINLGSSASTSNMEWYERIRDNESLEVDGFPALVLYDSTGVNRLAAVTYRAANGYQLTTEGFSDWLEDAMGDYWIEPGDADADLYDPDDDTPAGATKLLFELIEQQQFHTLDASDQVDWFTFTPARGTTYAFGLGGGIDPVYTTAVTRDDSNRVTNTIPFLTLVGDVASGLPVTNVVETYSWVTNSTSSGTVSLSVVAEAAAEQIYAITNGLTSEHWITFISSETNLAATASTVYTNVIDSKVNSRTVSTGSSVTNGYTETQFDYPLFKVWDADRATVVQECSLEQLAAAPVFFTTNTQNRAYWVSVTNLNASAQTNAFTVTYHGEQTNVTDTVRRYDRYESAAGKYLVVSGILERVAYTLASREVVVTTNRIAAAQLWWVADDAECATYVETNRMEVVSSVDTDTRYTNVGELSYLLSYRTWKPGTVGFGSTNIRVKESAARVKIPVVRKNGSSPLCIRYRTEDIDEDGVAAATGYSSGESPADAAYDYFHQSGFITWAAGKNTTTNLEIELIQDLRPVWEGDEQFRVVLESYDPDDVYMAGAFSSATATVTIVESATKQPGTVGFSAYAVDDGEPTAISGKTLSLTVAAGKTITFTVSRDGGSDGSAEAVATVSGGKLDDGSSALPVTDELYWDNGEAGESYDGTFTVDTSDYLAGSKLTVRLSVAGAKPAALVSAAVTVLDSAVAARVSETAGIEEFGISGFKSAGDAWFWNGDGNLSMLPQTKGGKGTCQLTLNGPGVLSFDWTVDGWDAADSFTCSGGLVSGRAYSGAAGSEVVLVKAGKQTVTWSYARKSDDGDAVPVLSNLMWEPLPAAQNPVPPDRSYNQEDHLSCEIPEMSAVCIGRTCEVTNSFYESYVVTDYVCTSPKRNTMVAATDPALVFLIDDDPKNNQRISWRVDTAIELDGERVVNPGPGWSFTWVDADDGTDAPDPPDVVDAEGNWVLLQGVAYNLAGAYDEAENATPVSVAAGQLPPGMRINTKTGAIYGTPTTPGVFPLVLRARGSSSVSVTFRVLPLNQLTGNYYGWVRPADGEAAVPYQGNASLSVSLSGKLTAKVAIGGNAYVFTGSLNEASLELDDESGDSIGSLSCEALYGKSVKVDGETYTNAISDVVISSKGVVESANLTLYSTHLEDGETVLDETNYTVTLYLDCWKAYPNLAAPFAGYYTAALPVDPAYYSDDRIPRGNGFATFTVGKSGSVKWNVTLADGKTASGSGILINPGQDELPDNGEEPDALASALVYLYGRPTGYNTYGGGISGRLELAADENSGLVSVAAPPGEQLSWWDNSPFCLAPDADGNLSSGFLSGLNAKGAYYDSVINLSTYYLGRSLIFADNAESPGADLIPSDYDGSGGTSGFQRVTYDSDSYYLDYDPFLPFGTALVISDTKIAAPKQKLVRSGSQSGGAWSDIIYTEDQDTSDDDSDDDDDYDEDSETSSEVSRNISNLNFSFTRATGLISGTFSLYYEQTQTNGSYRKKTSKVVLKGVYSPFMSGQSADEGGCHGMGYYLIPTKETYLDAKGVKRSFSCSLSLPFELNCE